MKLHWLVSMCALVASLSGCATLEGNGPIAQARRAAFVKAHPDDPFNSAITAGLIVKGMTQEELIASQGDGTCVVENTLDDGYTMRCQTIAQGMAEDVGTLVWFDDSGRITQWVH